MLLASDLVESLDTWYYERGWAARPPLMSARRGNGDVNLFKLNRRPLGIYAPAQLIEEPVYKYSRLYERESFDRLEYRHIGVFYDQCGAMANPLPAGHLALSARRDCVIRPDSVRSLCAGERACETAYILLREQFVARHTRAASERLAHDIPEARRHYNSCGPISVQYPAYMRFARDAGAKYLERAAVELTCYASHWIMGTARFHCVKIWLPDGRHVMRWNQGAQPWCRAKSLDLFFKWLTAIMTIIGILLVIVVVFVAVAAIGRTRRTGEEANEAADYAPLGAGGDEPAGVPEEPFPGARFTSV